MSASVSKHLSPLALRGITKAGDILLPGDGELPRFSATPFVNEIDRIADYMTSDDRGGFRFLMSLFGILPAFAVRALLKIADRADRLPGFIAPPFRMINIGVKGAVYTLYFSDTSGDGFIRRAIGWDTRCGPAASDPWASRQGQTPEAAFARARSAEPELRKLTVEQRLERILRLREVILRRQSWILDEIQKATGKSRSDAMMSEIFGVLDHLAYMGKFAPKFLADRKAHTPLALMGKKSRVWFEPMGTVLCISPWNYPFYQAVVPTTLALACGNAVVYKPSEQTPMTGVFEKLLEEAGIPGGWINVVYGDGKTGSQLIELKPDKIFFIGSTRTGRKIMEQASKHLIPVELELGGKDPMIVFDDAEITRAAAGAAWGAFTNTGQSCTSVERLYVQESIYERFRDQLVREAERVTQAVDSDGGADIGRMTTADQVRIVAEHVEEAVAKGARLLTGAHWDRRSHLIPAIVVEGATPDMRIVREETFGPVLPILSFADEEDAVRLANDSEYGLSASVWGKDPARCERVARRIVTGNVSINNVMLTEGNHALPFGGAKRSGFGRFKGEFGFYSFSNIKSVIVDANSRKIEANWYPYTSRKFSLFTRMTEGAYGKGAGALGKFLANGLGLESYSAKAHKERHAAQPAGPPPQAGGNA